MKKKLWLYVVEWRVYILFISIFVSFFVILRTIRPQDLHTTYSLIFVDVYATKPTVEIASFNQGEQWKGMFTYDTERTLDGETGMNIFSLNETPTKITLSKTVNLRPYEKIYASIYIDRSETLQDIKSFILRLSDKKNNQASYPISHLKQGWNVVQMKLADFTPKGIDFATITTTTIELVSKKDKTAAVSLDRIWAQHPLNFAGFATADPSAVSLKTESKQTFLQVASTKPTPLIFAKSTDRSRFSYTVSLSPLKYGMFGMSFTSDAKLLNGYVFAVSGKQMTQWHLLKKENGKETELQHGTFSPNTFEKGALAWIKTEKNGDTLSFFLTLNGQQYVPITELKDTTFQKGYIGIVSQGAFLIESVTLKE